MIAKTKNQDLDREQNLLDADFPIETLWASQYRVLGEEILWSFETMMMMMML